MKVIDPKDDATRQRFVGHQYHCQGCGTRFEVEAPEEIRMVTNSFFWTAGECTCPGCNETVSIAPSGMNARPVNRDAPVEVADDV